MRCLSSRNLLKWLLLFVLLFLLVILWSLFTRNDTVEFDNTSSIHTVDARIDWCVHGQNCRLPDCLCFGMKHYPKHFQRGEVPQIVIFASDDSLIAQFADYYRQIFADHKNPNGCPFSGTLFISDPGETDFRLVRQFYDKGWEIGQHGAKHIAHSNTSILTADINEMRTITHKETGIPFSELIGWRSPYLHTLMDGEIETLKKLKFTYSMTFKTNTYSWPFTLDYGFTPLWPKDFYLKAITEGTSYWNRYNFLNAGFGTKQIKESLKATSRFWIIPNSHYDAKPFDDRQVGYVDDLAASWADPKKLNTASEIERLLVAAFIVHYHGDRSPFIVNIHGHLFNRNPKALPAVINFFKMLASRTDVFVLSANKALQWVRNPVKLRDIYKFEPWKC